MNAPSNAIEIKAAITACFAFITTLIGWVGWAIIIWVCCIVLDYLSGTWAAKAHGEWSSAIARQGLWHKLGEIIAILVAAMCDIALGVVIDGAGVEMPIDFEYTTLITPVVTLWYIFTELGSICENAKKLGAPIPEWLINFVHKAKDKTDNK